MNGQNTDKKDHGNGEKFKSRDGHGNDLKTTDHMYLHVSYAILQYLFEFMQTISTGL